MEIKPAGPERDRQIAELRDDAWIGICPICGEKTYQEREGGLDELSCPDTLCNGWITLQDKPYSTDIATAFELWEEMERHADTGVKYEGTDTFRQQSFGLDHIAGEMYQCYLGDMEHVDESLCSAISGAWLKWRGQ
jgi:hypothetical protein